MSDEKETVEVETLEGGLTKAEKAQLEAEAKAEFQKELKAEAKKKFKEAHKKKLQAAVMFSAGKDDSGEDLATLKLELASYPKYIILDGTVYHSGRTYTKKRGVIAVLADQMDRGWRQEAARLGEKLEMTHERRTIINRYGAQLQ